jgi:hypothetical protein
MLRQSLSLAAQDGCENAGGDEEGKKCFFHEKKILHLCGSVKLIVTMGKRHAMKKAIEFGKAAPRG